jgi:chromosome segregation ATPase
MSATAFPWEHLVDENSLRDLPADEDLLQTQNTDLRERIRVLEAENAQLLEDVSHNTKATQAATDMVAAKQDAMAELQRTSKQVFEKLEYQIKDLEKQVQEAASVDLQYAVIVQAIISYKQGLFGDAKQKRTLTAVLRWMQQRANVVRYLQDKNLYPAVQRKLTSSLLVSEDFLIHLVQTYVV